MALEGLDFQGILAFGVLSLYKDNVFMNLFTKK
jgi:hypothetical protein